MHQTEITVQVFDNYADLKQKLQTLGFTIVEEWTMVDYYYSKYSIPELLTFSYENLIKNSFIIRDIVDSSNTELIYKNKTLDDKGNVIKEEKSKCIISDCNKARNIFTFAGLTCWCELKQEIVCFKKDNIEFLLQNAEDLGCFIEYEEDDSMQNLSSQEKFNILIDNLKQLNLDTGKDFSCKKVYMKFLKNNNVNNDQSLK